MRDQMFYSVMCLLNSGRSFSTKLAWTFGLRRAEERYAISLSP